MGETRLWGDPEESEEEVEAEVETPEPDPEPIPVPEVSAPEPVQEGFVGGPKSGGRYVMTEDGRRVRVS